jgi:predicted outer membrane repeat protein
MQVVDDGTINIEFSDINNNQAGRDGGGLIVIANFNIVDSEFINNISNLNGSGIWMENMHAQQDIARCLFTGNESITSGGAIYMDNISPTLTNVTISGNYAVFQTGIYADGNITPSNPIIRNCIIWDDTIFTYNSFPVYEYSCIEGSYAGTDVINTDPLFVDQATGNYHLLPASPCIDTGDPNSPLDDDGSRADMGAFTSGVDSDSDGLSDINEVTFGTDPFDQDTDDDGLSDGEEVYIFFTDPLMVDTDSDGMQDGTEVGNDTWWLGEPWNGIGGTDTSINIPDADPSTTTDPLDDDTDNDGLMDGQEDANQDGEFLGIELDPNNFDGDNDGLGDGLELGLAAPNGNDTDMTVFVADADPSTTTRATLRDTDGGGIDDGIEDANRNGRIDAGEIDPRDASDDSVYLKHNGASVGGHTTLNFYACEPGSLMVLCYSLTGSGPTVFANVTLDLSQPIRQLPVIHIDSNGSGQIGPLPVPASVSVGDQAWFQGVQVSIFGTSTVLTTTNMTPLTIQ